MKTTRNHDHAWDSDIEMAVLSLRRSQITDPDYWFSTVNLVEAGYCPKTNKMITRSELKAWVDRCKTMPEEDHVHAPTPSQPRCVHPKD